MPRPTKPTSVTKQSSVQLIAGILGFSLLLTGSSFGAPLFPVLKLHSGDWAGNALTGDVNGDGITDMVVSNNDFTGTRAFIEVFFGTGGGMFEPGGRYLENDEPDDIVLADLDGDGLPELVTITIPQFSNDNRLTILPNLGNGTFASPVRYPVEPRGPGRSRCGSCRRRCRLRPRR